MISDFEARQRPKGKKMSSNNSGNPYEIAIVGMAGRFPGARNVEEFWLNLRNGVESITFHTDDELTAAGVHQALLNQPDYVKASALLEDSDMFDASFFGYSPREAEVLDPQHRVFLECAWEALENAGYDSEKSNASISVYAGASRSSYIINIYSNPDIVDSVGSFQVGISNDKDYVATRVSYKLNLIGPSVTVQTGCSTSLVAISLACQGLLNHQCDIALAGGVAISNVTRTGYVYQEGGITSPDGHCRAFDAKAEGTVSGNGAGIVVLKRVSDAIAAGDHIHAVIKGSAINNDGAAKIGYTAPSVEGQAAVIAEALAMSDTNPETISYIEAHGTGTKLGDPIEIAALTKAFRASTSKKSFCAIGSAKSNVGHLDTAAGVTGLIKTVLALQHQQLPPSLHFERPNPNIDFANSPFYVNATLAEWNRNGTPRRAGVSSFGIGGTNAHVVVEEAPLPEPSTPGRSQHVLIISAKTDTALEAATANLCEHLKQHPDLNIADLAYTLQVGRRDFQHRRMLVGRDITEMVAALEQLDSKQVVSSQCESGEPPVIFMFPGQGTQSIGMARELYDTEPIFRKHLTACARLLEPILGGDLISLLYPAKDDANEAAQQLGQTAFAQPALFAVEYSLAQLWMAWGVRPTAMIGHSLGEYVAACLAGVFGLEEALRLVTMRGRLMQQADKGTMLAVALPEAQAQQLCNDELSLAAINGPSMCVVSGTEAAVAEAEHQLGARGVSCRRLHTSHAFHSQMMDPILNTFATEVGKLNLQSPRIPYLSNLSGTWITDAEATDANYWARHLRQPVRFADGIQELFNAPKSILLECGPGQTLAQLAKHQPKSKAHVILSSLPHLQEGTSPVVHLFNTLGRVWLAGSRIDWDAFYAGQRRRRIPLPTYPFEHKRYWVERRTLQDPQSARQSSVQKRKEVSDWFYAPLWKQTFKSRSSKLLPQQWRWLVFVDECGLGQRLAARLEQEGQKVVCVTAGTEYRSDGAGSFTIDCTQPKHYELLLKELLASNHIPERIVHLWSITPVEQQRSGVELFEATQARGFYSLLSLAQTLSKLNVTDPVRIDVVSNNIQRVTGAEELCPEKATVLGASKVIPQEYRNIKCLSVDVVVPELESPRADQLITQLWAELTAFPVDTTVAYRGDQRWVQTFEPVRIESAASNQTRLREGGTYLITGGLGGVGLVLAEHLARTQRAKLVLTGRSAFPEKADWNQWLTRHDEHDATSRKIRVLQELEKTGAEVLVLHADVSDEKQMREVLARTDERFGGLDGVIHGAGVAGRQISSTIQDTGMVHCERHFQAKARGLYVLERVLADRKLDFCLLLSSLSSVLGGLGFFAYAAANQFMDAFAQARNEDESRWISINWDGWRLGEEKERGPRDLDLMSISATEGADCFQRILSLSPFTQLAVSTTDLNTRIAQWIKLDSVQPTHAEEKTDSITLYPRPDLASTYVAPRSELEQQVSEIWKQLLGIEQIGINDNFFELGGHSLLATQVISRLRKVLGVEIPLRILFENTTLARLASSIEFFMESREGAQAPQIERRSRETNLPLSFAQQRMWFLYQLEPDSYLYNLHIAVRLIGSLDIPALQKTLDEIVGRHETLHTVFSTLKDEHPFQVVVPAQPVALPLIELSELPIAERMVEMSRLDLEEAHLPFDLSCSPLLRAKLLRLGEQDHVALLTMHHIAGDGWSMGVLLKEVATLYTAFTQGRPSPLPEMQIQYGDFAIWQREWLQGEVLEAQLEYWMKQLGGNPQVLDLPTDHPRPETQTYRGTQHKFTIPTSLSESLLAMSHREGVTPFMLLLAAFQTLLQRYTGQDDIIVGSPIANRNRAEIENLIGYFVNTLVLRGDLSGNPTFRELLGRVREVTLGAYAHQDVPFELIVEKLQPDRKANYTPLFQVCIEIQNTPMQTVELPNLTLYPVGYHRRTSHFDMTLLLIESPEGFFGYIEYNTDIFEEHTIAEMVKCLMVLLKNVVANPELRLLDIPLTEEDPDPVVLGGLQSMGQSEGHFIFD